MTNIEFEEKELVVLKKYDDTNYRRIYEVIKNYNNGKIDVRVQAEKPIDKQFENGQGALGIGKVFTNIDAADFEPFM